MKHVLAATGNRDKIAEIADVLGAFGLQVIGKDELEAVVDDPEETGTSFDENALIKARALEGIAPSGMCIIADDSGLEVDVLDGVPGVYSSRFAEMFRANKWNSADNSLLKNCEEDSLTKDDENNALLLKLLENVPLSERGARFVCSIALIRPGDKPVIVQGVCEGHIAMKPSGARGFGYDPLFIPNEYADKGLSFADLTADEKNEISHRGRALIKLKDLFDEEDCSGA